jgi:uroporphyrinogen-III decarboxylase
MGHAAYAAGGVDYNDDLRCPFDSVEEVLAFDPWEAYGTRDHDEVVARFENDYEERCELMPDLVNMTGVYITCVSGLIKIFGWEMLLAALGTNPEAFGAVANRYADWSMQFYEALADSSVPVVYSHDDIVWTCGAFYHPDWYQKYVFPNLKRLYRPLIEAGKTVLFVADGDYTAFVDDIAACGVHGFFFEPLTALRYVVENYGQTHVIIGNADTRTLLSGDRDRIRGEVSRCMDTAKDCPGWFMGVSNMIPPNTPVEAALYYNEVYEELAPRD